MGVWVGAEGSPGKLAFEQDLGRQRQNGKAVGGIEVVTPV